MATQARVSTPTLEEYLATSYRPDREYIDGDIRERHVGKWEHARLQFALAAWFSNHESEWSVMGSTEQRTWVARTRVRIPDLVLVRIESQPPVLLKPPVLVVEILSPDDTFSEMRERVADYQRMGVRTVWIIDPKTRTGQMCSGDTWTAAGTLTVPGSAIHVVLDELFRSLDDPRPVV